MKKEMIFKDDKFIFSTPDVFDKEDDSRVGSVAVYINKYGKMIAEISNRILGTGYYSESLASVCGNLDNETLDYLLIELKRERERRGINNERD